MLMCNNNSNMNNFSRDNATSIDASKRARFANWNKLTLFESVRISRVCCVSIDESVYEKRILATNAIEDIIKSIVIMR